MDRKLTFEPDYFLHIEPLLTTQECGDIGTFVRHDGNLFIALLDVLGHGAEAYKVAMSALEYLHENFKIDLVEMITGMHKYLHGTRGLVGNLCRINLQSGQLEYVGIGNVDAKIFGREERSLLNGDGVIGYKIPTPKLQSAQVQANDVLFMCTDGIKRRFSQHEITSLFSDSAEKIAEKIVKTYGREHDDKASLIVKIQ